jgi:hypothetical protein
VEYGQGNGVSGLVADQAAVTEAIPIVYDGQPAPATSPRDLRADRDQQEQQQQADAGVQHGPQAEQQQQQQQTGEVPPC